MTSDSGSKAKVAIVGIHPPPYGGVGIHLKRVLPYMEEAGIDYVMYNTGLSKISRPNVVNVGWSIRWLISLMFMCPHKILHFHTSRWVARVLAAFIHKFGRCDIIFTAHGASLVKSITSKNPIKRLLCRWALRQTRFVIATNVYIKELLVENGFPETKVTVLPAFIPPLPDADSEPLEVSEFCKKHHPILMAIGRPALIDGKDIYGLKVMTELAMALVEEFPEIGLVVFLFRSGKMHVRFFDPLMKKITEKALADHILFYESKGEFYPALKDCDVFLRPTTTDGDANSIREALWEAVPVVASDVIPRPRGCKLYRLGDDEALLQQVRNVLRNLEQEKNNIKNMERYNPVHKLVKVYEQLISG
ncbi:MAG: glycosyltransferase family 4 protein [Desulfobacteraceae bacterium]|nr:glycosyltransferase family 4 protein [Desulfobacteraceae bacterium]